MNLLYIWNEKYYLTTEEKGYLINSKYDIKFYESEMRLCINQNDKYIDRFWGENIFDIMAVVGENGSGKTRLANCIMDTLNQLNIIDTTQYAFQFIIIFESKSEIKIFATDKFENLSVESSLTYQLYNANNCKEIEKLKMGYFTNVLSLDDYKYEKYGVVFDASLGGCIRKSFKYNFEMHYIDNDRDVIVNYYEDEIKKMLDFINSDFSGINIPFVLPKNIVISLNDYHINLRYISDNLDRMGEKRKEILDYKDKNKYIIEEKCRYILQKCKYSWCGHLIVNLMLNLFRELCVPQTTGDKLEDEALMFLEKLKGIDNWSRKDIFEIIRNLLESIQDDKNEYIINHYREFIDWISTIPIIAGYDLNSINGHWILNLSKHNKIVKDLLTHYNKTNFVYPYLSFDFGLSTGEFNFLKLFSKISELYDKGVSDKTEVINNLGHRVKCENIFLYFDEADLSLHPGWQQKYLDWLLQFITTYFKEYTVQIIIATHSPIMLSDFPQDNVLYLWKKDGNICAGKRKIKTFGNNIHTLYMDSFFLENAGTMGAFAERKINKIASDLKQGINLKDNNILKIISGVGDDIIRNKLMQIYNNKNYTEERVEKSMMDEEVVDATIKIIRNQINDLESTIRKLERMKSDKN